MFAIVYSRSTTRSLWIGCHQRLRGAASLRQPMKHYVCLWAVARRDDDDIGGDFSTDTCIGGEDTQDSE